GSSVKWRGSMSTNTGRAPARTTAFAVAAKLNDGTTTSSPCPIPTASSANSSALVPELTATQGRPTTCSANSASNAATSGPCASIPDVRTRSIAARSAGPSCRPLAEIGSVPIVSGGEVIQDTVRLLVELSGTGAAPPSAVLPLQRHAGAPDPADPAGGHPDHQRVVGDVRHDDGARADHRPPPDDDRRDADRAGPQRRPLADRHTDGRPVGTGLEPALAV